MVSGLSNRRGGKDICASLVVPLSPSSGRTVADGTFKISGEWRRGRAAMDEVSGR